MSTRPRLNILQGFRMLVDPLARTRAIPTTTPLTGRGVTLEADLIRQVASELLREERSKRKHASGDI